MMRRRRKASQSDEEAEEQQQQQQETGATHQFSSSNSSFRTNNNNNNNANTNTKTKTTTTTKTLVVASKKFPTTNTTATAAATGHFSEDEDSDYYSSSSSSSSSYYSDDEEEEEEQQRVPERERPRPPLKQANSNNNSSNSNSNSNSNGNYSTRQPKQQRGYSKSNNNPPGTTTTNNTNNGGGGARGNVIRPAKGVGRGKGRGNGVVANTTTNSEIVNTKGQTNQSSTDNTIVTGAVDSGGSNRGRKINAPNRKPKQQSQTMDSNIPASRSQRQQHYQPVAPESEQDSVSKQGPKSIPSNTIPNEDEINDVSQVSTQDFRRGGRRAKHRVKQQYQPKNKEVSPDNADPQAPVSTDYEEGLQDKFQDLDINGSTKSLYYKNGAQFRKGDRNQFSSQRQSYRPKEISRETNEEQFQHTKKGKKTFYQPKQDYKVDQKAPFTSQKRYSSQRESATQHVEQEQYQTEHSVDIANGHYEQYGYYASPPMAYSPETVVPYGNQYSAHQFNPSFVPYPYMQPNYGYPQYGYGAPFMGYPSGIQYYPQQKPSNVYVPTGNSSQSPPPQALPQKRSHAIPIVDPETAASVHPTETTS